MVTSNTPSPFQTGPRLIDGGKLNAALANPQLSTQAAITAGAGGTIGAAVLMDAAINHITVSASGGDSVILPPAALGLEIIVANDGANAITVYATGSDTINGTAGATGISQPAGAYVTYFVTSKTKWHGETAASGTFTNLVVTTINKYTLTTPASGATLTIADGKTLTANHTLTVNGGDAAVLAIAAAKTLTVSNSLTLAGTDATVMTFPSTSATIARTDAANTFTGTQTVGALVATTVNGNTFTTGTGVLTIAAAKTLTASNTLTLAGTDGTTMTFPGTSATVARTDAANTFTGTQTIGALVATGITQAPVAVGSSLTITSTTAGASLLLNTAGGSTATLPAATGTGNVYKFYVTTTATSAAHKILAASGSDFLNGIVTGENANTAKCFASAAATNHSIQMPFAGTQPSGGFIGDWFEFTDIAANLWTVKGMYQAGVTPTTPFSSATS